MARLKSTHFIFIAMGVGFLAGVFFPGFATHLEPLSTIFLRLIKTIAVPIVFSTLVVGIAGHGDLKAVGRLGVKSLVYFEIVTTIALVLGLAIANFIKPGVGLILSAKTDVIPLQTKSHSMTDAIVNIFPQNFIEAAARGDILEVVVFAVIFAIALSLIGEKKRPIVAFCESLAEAMFKFTNIIMLYAPIGIGAAIAYVIGSKGLAVMSNLGLLILSMYAGLILIPLLVFLPIALIARVPLKKFISNVEEPAVIAFSTASSEAALPKAMENMEKMGVPREVVAFVIPTGYSFNLDGSTLYLSIAAVFAAQASGINLSISQQLLIGFTMIFASKGVAGVPRASIVVLAGTLPSFGVSLEAVAIILGVDTILDMGRTTINVVGNCLASVVMAKWEKRFGEKAVDVPADSGA